MVVESTKRHTFTMLIGSAFRIGSMMEQVGVGVGVRNRGLKWHPAKVAIAATQSRVHIAWGDLWSGVYPDHKKKRTQAVVLWRVPTEVLTKGRGVSDNGSGCLWKWDLGCSRRASVVLVHLDSHGRICNAEFVQPWKALKLAMGNYVDGVEVTQDDHLTMASEARVC